MKVLYRELKSFAHLESYIRENPLSVIYSNVAISWAIHDQKLDEGIDISNKTTTNIKAEEFCKSVDLGQHFLDNQEGFHQQSAIEALKSQLSSYRKLYDALGDVGSQDSLFSILLFWLCPYTPWQGKFGEDCPHGTYDSNDMDYIISNQLEIGESKPRLQLSIAYNLSQFVTLPLLLQTINGSQRFSLDTYLVEEKYRVIFTAEPEQKVAEPVVVEAVVAEVRVAENPEPVAEPEVAVVEASQTEVVVAEIEAVVPEVAVADSGTEIPETDINGKIQENFGGAEENAVKAEDFTENRQNLEEEIDIKWENEVPNPVAKEETSPLVAEEEGFGAYDSENMVSQAEITALKELLAEIDLPEGEEKAENQAEIEEMLEKSQPELPALNTVAMARDLLEKSLDLLGTMGELLAYLKANYPSEDPVCQDLLESMGIGVNTLQGILSAPLCEE